MGAPAKKKLLVLDVNGLLLDTYFKNEKRPNRPADGKVNKHHVYRRPYCDEFIEFCFENFEIGIWSSSKQHNVNGFINFIFGDLKNKLLFSWHQADCTDTGLKVPGNRFKPVFLKELSKLWNNVKPDLPWEKGEYGPSNTLLIDDSPYKALRNPPYTAVFPDPYKVSNKFDDSLGGALRKYLEGLASASSVQHYVKHHTFGQLPIGKGSRHWSFFRNILLPMGDSATYKEEEENDMVNAATPNLERSISLGNSEAGLHTGNGQHSESSTCNGKRKKKRRNRPVASTDQSSGPCMEEENGVVNVAMLNMEKNRTLENREINLQSGNGQQSESSSRSGRRKKRHKAHLTRSTNQSSVPDMEEENVMVNMAMLDMEKSISLENRKVNLQSGNGRQSESSSRSDKWKKKHKDRLGTRTEEYSVPGKEEENSIANVAMSNMEESLENRKENLLSGNRHQSESGSRSGKRKKRHRDGLAFSTNQSSVSGMEEENSVIIVEKAIKNKDKAMATQTDKDRCGSGQQSESSSRSGKRKKRSRDGLATSTNQSSVPGMEVENKAMAAQTDEDHRGNKPYTVTGRKFHDHNGFRYGDKGHHNKPVHFRANSHLNSNRWTSSHAPKSSYGGSQASYFPGRQFEADQGHKNGFYTSNNMYCRNAVDSNFPPHQLEGYINDGQDRWHMHGGYNFQHAPPQPSYNPSHTVYPLVQSYNRTQRATEFRCPITQPRFPSSQSHVQVPATHYGTQYQCHGSNFQYNKNKSKSRHSGRR